MSVSDLRALLVEYGSAIAALWGTMAAKRTANRRPPQLMRLMPYELDNNHDRRVGGDRANRWSALTLAGRWVAICVEAGQTFVAGTWAGQTFV